MTGDAQWPDRLPVLPLRDLVFFPQLVMPLLAGRGGSLAALDAAAETPGKLIFLVSQRDGEVTDPAAADLFRVGVVARVLQAARMPNGVTKVLLEGLARARVTRYTPVGALLRAVISVEPFTAPAAPDEEEQVVARRATALFEEYVALQRRVPAEVVQLVQASEQADRRAFTIAAHLAVRHARRQELLELPSLADLHRRLVALMEEECELLRLERKIEDDVRGSLFRNQREFFLQEQLKAIHRELGQEDDDVAELEAQLEVKGLPALVETRARRELRRLRRLPSTSPEAGVARGFLDWILALPWHERDEADADLARARAVLDREHAGLDEVKDRVLDYIAVLAQTGKLDGPILCLVGPPGVGKTSLGRSIADALGRRFVRMSLGGVRDEAEIRGHRRTYVGAMPGRIIQAMRRAEVVNPVILLDEIDKLGQDYRGDPASALLEVLDPEQHHAFSDHYLELDYDLSQVLFVTTANALGKVPEALRDRLEIIRLPGYLDHEKLTIAANHLLPRQLRRHGLDPAMVEVPAETLQAMLRGYTREAGVRDLERRCARLARKLARRRAEKGAAGDASLTAPAAERTVVTVADLPGLLGPAPHDPDDTRLEDKVGVALGLAYTSVGGEVLEVEVSSLAGRGRLQLTGTLGDVMKESANAALSYTRSRIAAFGLDPEFHRTRDLHLHIPAGATPKDGPSAGIAITAAIVSALTGVPLRGDVAMTGEITLRGRVLAIGGLREKLIAARRSGVREVILPAANRRQLDDMPDEVRGELIFHPVESMDDAMGLALRQPSAPARARPPAAKSTDGEGRARRRSGRPAAPPAAGVDPNAIPTLPATNPADIQPEVAH
ncbi:MAG: endopeptidase La [Gemmatimonadaceae bacterium]